VTSLADIAARIRAGSLSAADQVEETLAAIAGRNDRYLCFTRVLADDARRDAGVLDERLARGEDPGPLAGVPFAVKDLFDVAGLATTAGAALRTGTPPATRDAEAVARLKDAGGILVGTLNMDEFAYGFATVNAHFGTTRNPHDPERLAGGSSGGSAAAVAAGLVPLTLGSDTNGSIRVPASLCGVWGIRPGDGVFPSLGAFPFVERFDQIGPFVRSAADLAVVYEILAGKKLALGRGGAPRVARLDGWFARHAGPDAWQAVETVTSHLGARTVSLPSAEAARSAAFLITAGEAGAFHLPTLRAAAASYDPAVRDRLLAGAMLPAALLATAQRFQPVFRAEIDILFRDVDILVAPATPVVAPRIDEGTMMMDGKPVSARANLGLFTQPLTLAGIPVAAAPLARPGKLPIGLQFATAPGREAMLFDLLLKLERDGVLGAAEVAS
jgi:aspartyl-tRNA(Asn)/glutamyl-tRNA(Gln) amidotransferase subunit A